MSTRPFGRVPLVLVLLVLTGLVGMHGLTAAAFSLGASAEGMRTAGHSAHSPDGSRHPDARPLAAAQESASATSLCHHDSTGGHSVHSVSDCAAAGLGAAYLPPAPAYHSGAPAVPLPGVLRRTSAERAPPDLAQLQLLRI
ncbi:DUF6153 family protein [Actinocorallia libanotica]|uniref:DUF6153 family protein n=1 Tax=Actinocorallia libanotica TaxID=46162 RepID=A0ABN1Q7J3_9ACTN